MGRITAPERNPAAQKMPLRAPCNGSAFVVVRCGCFNGRSTKCLRQPAFTVVLLHWPNGRSMISDDDSWIELLPLNRFGLRVLQVETARMLAVRFPDGWYIAPYAMRWTVGKTALSSGERRFHLLEAGGEPILFPDPAAAAHYLRTTLKLQSFIDLSDAVKPGGTPEIRDLRK